MENLLKSIYDEAPNKGAIDSIMISNGCDLDSINLILNAVSDFTKNRIAPNAMLNDSISPEISEGGKVSMPAFEDVYRDMGSMGLAGIIVPKEYGGLGLSYGAHCAVTELLSRGEGSIGVSLSIHGSCADAIAQLGTEEAKRKYLPRLAAGEHWGAIALTEPGAGSDVGSAKTRAELRGDKYIVNGEKIFITNAGWAHDYILLASTCPEKGKKGQSAFILERDFPGFKVTGLEKKLGLNPSATGRVLLEDCEIPKENLLGEEGNGLRYVLETLSGGRISIAAQATGIAQSALDCAREYALQREQSGRKIAEFSDVKNYLSEMEENTAKSRWLYLNAADKKDRGADRWYIDASKAKLFASEKGSRTCDLAIQVHGGYGYTKELPVEKYWRDVRVTRIYEGTSEVQKHIIENY